MEIRNLPMRDFTTRDENGEMIIEGYFAVFNSPYEIVKGGVETIAPGAFDGTLDGDVRALLNHDTTLVLGRTTAKTLTLAQDEIGLWGRIVVNPKDGDATNGYFRVQRGDVNQCSFGFDILDEETEILPDGTTHWIIKAVKLYEVSIVTFPAYPATHAEARTAEVEARKAEAWKAIMMQKLKGGCADGIAQLDAE